MSRDWIERGLLQVEELFVSYGPVAAVRGDEAVLGRHC